MDNLNKNQRKFFESAIEHFGVGSDSVKYKELKDYAINKGLILPTSALKRYCATKRGYYNLFEIGIKPIKEEPKKPLKDFKGGSIIKEKSVFAGGGTKKPDLNTKVYLVVDSTHKTWFVHRTIAGAYNSRKHILHDNGVEDIEYVIEQVENDIGAIINSNNSNLWCYIRKVDLKP